MPSGASNLNVTGSTFLKRFYTPKYTVNTIAAHSSRLLNLITFDPTGSGDDYTFMNEYADNPSGSVDFSEAQDRGQNAASSAVQFKVTWCDDFQVPSVANNIIAKTRNNAGAWLQQLKNEMDSSLRYSAHRRSVALFTTGYGELATVTNAIGAGFVITLGNPRTGAVDRSTAYRFVKGMKLVFSASISANALRAGQSAVVTKVDYSAGTITLDTALNAIAGLAQNDVIFTKGDRQDSATPARLRPAGLPAWVPTTAPTPGENYFGQDRTTSSFLYGWIIDGTATGFSLQQAITQAATQASTIGNAKRLVAVVSPARYQELAASQDNKQYTEITGRGGFGYKTLLAYADGIEVPVIADKYCLDSELYVVDPKTIINASMGEAPHVAEEDGNRMLRQSTSAGVEVRIEAFECFAFNNTAACAVVKLA